MTEQERIFKERTNAARRTELYGFFVLGTMVIFAIIGFVSSIYWTVKWLFY